MNPLRTALRTRPLGPAVLALAAAAMLGGCGGSGNSAREILGIDQSVPDEFAVAPTAPLAMPPSLDVLPPPQPGAPRPQEVPLTAQARGILFNNGEPVVTDTTPSAGSSAIFARAGGVTLDPAERYAIDASSDEDGVPRTPLESMIGAPVRRGTIVDPEAEAERIRAAQASGQPITAGETAIIEPRQRNWMEILFDW